VQKTQGAIHLFPGRHIVPEAMGPITAQQTEAALELGAKQVPFGIVAGLVEGRFAVVEGGAVVGIVSKIDVIDFLARRLS